MKLTILLLTTALIQVHATGLSQMVSYSGNNVSLETVFKDVERQTGFAFFYHEDVLKDAKSVSIAADNLSLSDFLDELFMGQLLSYSIKGKNVIVSKKTVGVDLKSTPISLFAPDAEPIKGVVKDSTGMPLVGATVTNKRTKKSVQTNAKGEFSIEGEEGDVLAMTYVGFENQDVNVTANSIITILRASTSPLDEVQIMAYGRTTKRLNTGNVTTVKSTDIQKQNIDNPILALQGRVAGLIVTPSSGAVGSSVTVQLRGQNSLSPGFGTKTEPLYVIDGVPYTNNLTKIGFGANTGLSALSFINPADIASIEVLKDADQTAIYGSRGANGVILITTNKAKIGRTQFNLNASSGFGEVAKKLNLLSTEQYLEMRKEAFANDLAADPSSPQPNQFNAPDLTVWDRNRYTDWQEVLRGGTAKYYNIQSTLSGGSSLIQYLLSGTYNKQGFVYPGDLKDEKATGHFSITGNSANQKLQATLTGSYTVNKNHSSGEPSAWILLPPNAPAVYKENGQLNWAPDPVTGFGTWQNPFAYLYTLTESKTTLLNGTINVSYKVLPNLSLKIVAGVSELAGTAFVPWPLSSTDPAFWQFGQRSSDFSSNGSRSWSIEPHGLYETNISKGKLQVLIGGSLQSQNTEFETLTAIGFNSDALLRSLAAATQMFGRNSTNEYKYAGMFSRLNYNWRDKYIINLNARRDGSSRFGPGRQFGNFASVGAAWLFSNEYFLQSALPFLSFGKMRFSYGTSGNDAIQDYKYLELYRLPGRIYDGNPVIESQGVTNPFYGWESTSKLETALELGFIRDRIILNVVYFKNRSGNQLGPYELPRTAGNYSNFIANQDARIQNTGYEVEVTTSNFKTKNFRWSSAFNVSVQRNKLLKLAEPGFDFPSLVDRDSIGLVYINPVGNPFSGVDLVYEYRGVDPVTGQYLFSDLEGKPSLNQHQDRMKSIYFAPKYFGGISNTFTYKCLSLDVFFRFSKQRGVDPVYTRQMPGQMYNQPVGVLQRWRKPGDIADIQRYSKDFTLGSTYDHFKNSDKAYTDASFIRLQTLAVSYDLPQSWIRKMKINNFKIYIQGQNLWTFSNYEGLDPEVQDIQALPQLRVITGGLQIGL